MASLVLGIAGAAALGPAGLAWGGALGMSGAQIGFTVGSMIGNMMTKLPDVQGPRLGDLKVQSSTYGKSIPIYYGTSRGAGEVMWSSDLIETENEEEAGGKGGPSQSVTSYTYSVNCAVAVCAGEITGIRRMWANGNLIYDQSAGNLGPTGQSGNIRVYTGSETQVADSLLEAYLGAGNVPAHRGLAYVVFENLQLEKYGNRIPNFSFEVVANGNITNPSLQLLSQQRPILYLIQHPFIDGIYLATSRDSGNLTLHIIDAIAKTDRTVDMGVGNVGSGHMTYVEYGIDLVTGEPLPVNEIWVNTNSGGLEIAVALDAASLTIKRRIVPTTGPNIVNVGKIMYDKVNKQVLVICRSSTIFDGVRYLEPSSVEWVGANFRVAGILNNWFSENEVTGENSFCIVNYTSDAVFFSGGLAATRAMGGAGYIAYDSLRNRYATFSRNVSGNAVFRTFTDDGIYESNDVFTSNTTMGGLSVLTYWPIADKYVYRGTDDFKILNAETFEVERSLSFSLGSAQNNNNFEIAGLLDYAIGYKNGTTLETSGAVLIPITDRLSSNTVTLASIVTDICGRVDLSPGDIDVTDLTDEVEGYTIAQQMTARAAIDGLQAAFYFDAVESD